MNNRGQGRGSPRGGRLPATRGQDRGNPRGGRRSSCTDGHRSAHHSPQAGAGSSGPFSNEYSGSKELSSKSEMESPQQTLLSSYSNHSGHRPSFSAVQRQVWVPSATKDTLSCIESRKEGHISTESSGVNSKDLKGSVASDSTLKENSLSTLSHPGNLHMAVEKMQIRETRIGMTRNNDTSLPNNGSFPTNSPVSTTSHRNSELPEHSAFELCPTKAGGSVTLKASLLVQNRERRNEIKRSLEQKNGSVLPSGMVLLKSYLSHSEQINIVKLCGDLGLGPGGFYQPGYRDGAKLNLKMMCLGKNWDPETSAYGDFRPSDGVKPPNIPVELFRLVESAIKESHSRISKDSKASKSEVILPWMSPDICLVNFYSSSGRLGLHQDRDESEQSLRKGLPVVSFSIGDTAEFLYGDQRAVEKAHKVLLESGDVLIFGGKSRHIFHGVASIQPNTAPKSLLEKTNLRPGRLNLTFRQY